MTAVVAVDATVRAGVASVTHSGSNGGPGRLTSSVADVDPLTGHAARVGPRGVDRGFG